MSRVAENSDGIEPHGASLLSDRFTFEFSQQVSGPYPMDTFITLPYRLHLCSTPIYGRVKTTTAVIVSSGRY